MCTCRFSHSLYAIIISLKPTVNIYSVIIIKSQMRDGET